MKTLISSLLLALALLTATPARATVTLVCSVCYLISDGNYSDSRKLTVTFCTGAEAERLLGSSGLAEDRGYALIHLANGTAACVKLHYDGRYVTSEPLDNQDMTLLFRDTLALDGWEQGELHVMWVIQARDRNGHWLDPDYN